MEQAYSFESQQRELGNCYEKMKREILGAVKEICESVNMLDETYLKKKRGELDKVVEELHLTISNYFGYCDKEKQKVEYKISEQIDLSDFDFIGAELCKM